MTHRRHRSARLLAAVGWTLALAACGDAEPAEAEVDTDTGPREIAIEVSVGDDVEEVASVVATVWDVTQGEERVFLESGGPTSLEDAPSPISFRFTLAPEVDRIDAECVAYDAAFVPLLRAMQSRIEVLDKQVLDCAITRADGGEATLNIHVRAGRQ